MTVALITGALGGIGLACTEKLLERGISVIGTGSSPAKDKDEIISSLGDGFTYISCDISSSVSRENLFEQIRSCFGRLDILVNVAGIAPKERRDILEMTEQSYDEVMGVNTKGTMFITQSAAKMMLKNPAGTSARGYIVFVGSCSSYTSSPSRAEYCVSKAGVTMLTRLFAHRLAGDGILVNEVCPGIIRTDMTKCVKEKYDALIAGGLTPIPRWGEGGDVAKVVSALCDGSFGYTTGESIAVDGGMHIRRL